MIACVRCELAYATVKVGASVETMTTSGPYQLYAADILQCPGCGHRIARTANQPHAEHFQPDYHEKVEQLRTFGEVPRAWATAKEKETYCASEMTA